jgi:hypothetical protein
MYFVFYITFIVLHFTQIKGVYLPTFELELCSDYKRYPGEDSRSNAKMRRIHVNYQINGSNEMLCTFEGLLVTNRITQNEGNSLSLLTYSMEQRPS